MRRWRETKWAIDTLNANGISSSWSSVLPHDDWSRSPDPLIHSWRWLQPPAAFHVAFHEEVQAMVRDFRADFERQWLETLGLM